MTKQDRMHAAVDELRYYGTGLRRIDQHLSRVCLEKADQIAHDYDLGQDCWSVHIEVDDRAHRGQL